MASKKDHTAFRQRFASAIQLVAKRRAKPLHQMNAPQSIVILARECYGDCILLTPLIGSLKQEYPDLSIYIVAFSQIILNFFSADPNVAGVYHAKRNMRRYANGVLSKKFDLLFNPKDHPSTHFLLQSVLIRARYKVGHFNPNHVGLFDHLIALAPDTHESAKNLSLLTALKGEERALLCKPYLPPMPVSSEITAFLESLPQGKVLGINISAGHSGGHRTVAQWSALIKSFPAETFVIFSTPRDLDEKKALEEPHANVLKSPSTNNLYEVGEVVKKLKILITPDTSFVHIAACYDTPIIALYRKFLADRTQFGPLSTMQNVIVSPTADIIDIKPIDISSALHDLLEKLS
jgi:heptosyltransferase-3